MKFIKIKLYLICYLLVIRNGSSQRNISVKYNLFTCKHPEKITVFKATFIKVLGISKDRVSLVAKYYTEMLLPENRGGLRNEKLMRGGSMLPTILNSLHAKQAIMDAEEHQVENTYMHEFTTKPYRLVIHFILVFYKAV